MPGRQCRGWVFTLNNYTDDDVTATIGIPTSGLTGLVVGKEVGESGTPHLQGFIHFEKKKRFNAVRAYFAELYSQAVHLEAQAGTYQQAVDYIANNAEKPDPELLVNFTCEVDGRCDIARFIERVRAGASKFEMFDAFPSQMARMRHLYDDIMSATLEARRDAWRDVKCVVYYGEAGSGKTRKALYNDDGTRKGVFSIPCTNDLKWFDGYRGQEAILLDEMAASTVSYERWKQLVDGHALSVEVKGGMTSALWKTVYMTSNYHPDAWFPGVSLTEDSAYARRISEVWQFGVGSEPLLIATPRATWNASHNLN